MYPLDEYTAVISFEAVMANRVITVQIKDKAKMESSHFNATCVRATTVTGKEAEGCGRAWPWLESQADCKGSSGVG